MIFIYFILALYIAKYSIIWSVVAVVLVCAYYLIMYLSDNAERNSGDDMTDAEYKAYKDRINNF